MGWFGGLLIIAWVFAFFVLVPGYALLAGTAILRAKPYTGPDRRLWQKHAAIALVSFWGGTRSDNAEFVEMLAIPPARYPNENTYIAAILQAAIDHRRRVAKGEI